MQPTARSIRALAPALLLVAAAGAQSPSVPHLDAPSLPGARSSPLTAPIGSWVPLGPLAGAGPGVYDFMDNALEPQHVYAHSSAGVLRSTDGGASWSVHARWPGRMRVNDVSVAPTDPDRIALVRTRSGLLLSADGGASWHAPLVPPDAPVLIGVVHDPIVPDVLFCGTNTGVWRSTDGGVSFDRVLATATLTRDLLIDRHDRRRVYALVLQEGIYASDDGGDTWALRPLPAGFPSAFSIAIDPVDGRRLLIGSFGAALSEDGGQTWSVLGIDPADLVDRIAFDALDRDRFYATRRYQGLIVTSDAGATWSMNLSAGLERMGGHPNTVVASLARPGEVLVGGQGGVARSTDGGVTFHRSNAGLEAHAAVRAIAFDAGDPAHMVAKTGGSAFVSLDGGASWTESIVGHSFAGFDVVADPVTPGRFWAGGLGVDALGARLWRSDDGGFTFHVVHQNDPTYFWHLEPHPTQPDVVYGAGRGVQRSDDGGVTFTSLGLPTNWVWDVAVSPADPSIIVAAATSAVYWSHDAGASWTASTAPPLAIARELEADPADPMVFWAAAPLYVSAAQPLMRSDDGGRTWTAQSPALGGAEAVHVSRAHPSLILTNDFRRTTAFASTDGGATAFELGSGIESIVDAFHSTASELYAASRGHGVLVLR